MSRLQSIRVLLLNDDPTTRTRFAERLQSNGAWVVSAANVQKALVCLVKEHPAVVISDLYKPAREGVTLVREVRAMDRLSGAKTCALGIANTRQAEDRAGLLRAGFDDCLITPVDPDALCEKIAALVMH